VTGRRAARTAAVVLGGALALLVAGEIAVRALDVVDRLNGFPRTLYVAGAPPGPGYRLRPGADVVARGVRVRVNRHGLRGPDVERPAPGVRRVLVVGDSVAFGYRLEEPDTFAARLEADLERRTGGAFAVLNAGVEGYGTREQRALLEAELLALAPDVVVVVLNLNDYDEPPVLGARGVLTSHPDRRSGEGGLAAWSELYLLLRGIVETRGRLLLARDPGVGPDGAPRFGELDRFVSELRKRAYRDPADERVAAMLDELRAMRDATAARGVRLVVAVVPDGDQVGVAAPDLAPQERLRDACRTLALECVDLHARFAAAAGGGPLFLDIMHPNAAGQRLMADAVAERLVASPDR